VDVSPLGDASIAASPPQKTHRAVFDHFVPEKRAISFSSALKAGSDGALPWHSIC
jgi:hypothetical protein